MYARQIGETFGPLRVVGLPRPGCIALVEPRKQFFDLRLHFLADMHEKAADEIKFNKKSVVCQTCSSLLQP